MGALKELVPTLPGWVALPAARLLAPGVWTISAWQNGTTCVISGLEVAEYPDGKGVGPQWHVSVSRVGALKNHRPHPHDIRRAKRAFALKNAEEDNHHSGVARHFWIPVDPAHRVACECKTDESVVVEADGYSWSNSTDGTCRGCEFADLVGRMCPVHPSGVSFFFPAVQP
jgi:hypothetical protein